jgi:hypothetical protein
MSSTQLNFEIFALVGLIMLFLASGSLDFLLWLKDKSMSNWMLQ